MSQARRRFLALPTSAAKARSWVSAYAGSCGFSRSELSDIETSVGEAVANAIEHGNRMRGSYTVTCDFAGDVLRIEVRDGGAGFDEPAPPQGVPHHAETMRVPSLRGYGISLMRKLMTRVAFRDGGKTVILEKEVSADSASLNPPLEHDHRSG